MEKHYIEVQKELELVTKERDKGKNLQKLPMQAPSTTSMSSLIKPLGQTECAHHDNSGWTHWPCCCGCLGCMHVPAVTVSIPCCMRAARGGPQCSWSCARQTRCGTGLRS